MEEDDLTGTPRCGGDVLVGELLPAGPAGDDEPAGAPHLGAGELAASCGAVGVGLAGRAGRGLVLHEGRGTDGHLVLNGDGSEAAVCRRVGGRAGHGPPVTPTATDIRTRAATMRTVRACSEQGVPADSGGPNSFVPRRGSVPLVRRGSSVPSGPSILCTSSGRGDSAPRDGAGATVLPLPSARGPGARSRPAATALSVV